MNFSEWITLKDIIYLTVGILLGLLVSIILFMKIERLYLLSLILFKKAVYGTYTKVSIYNPIYDERDSTRFDNSGLSNGISTYEINMPYRYIKEDKLDISLAEFDQELIEAINLKYKTNYSTRHTKIDSISYEQNLIFKNTELDRKRYK